MRKTQAISDQRWVRSSQTLARLGSGRAEMAKANGTVNPTYPTYSSGGWMAIRMWLASSGLGPTPSAATAASPTGSQDDAEQNPLASSEHRANGLAAVAMRPNQKIGDRTHHGERPEPEAVTLPHPAPYQQREHRQQQAPQHDASLQRRPPGGKQEHEGRAEGRVLGDIGDGEVVGEDGDLEDHERRDATAKDEHHRKADRPGILQLAARCPDPGDDQRDRADQGDQDRDVSEDGDHDPSASAPYGWSGSYVPSSVR